MTLIDTLRRASYTFGGLNAEFLGALTADIHRVVDPSNWRARHPTLSVELAVIPSERVKALRKEVKAARYRLKREQMSLLRQFEEGRDDADGTLSRLGLYSVQGLREELAEAEAELVYALRD